MVYLVLQCEDKKLTLMFHKTCHQQHFAKHTNCIYLKRDPELATNKTDGHSLFYNEAKKINADIYSSFASKKV